MTRAARARRRGGDGVRAEIRALRSEVARLVEVVEARSPVRPETDPWDDLLGVAEASQLSGRSEQTIRRWIAAGAPIGGYILSLGIYLISRRRLRAHLLTRNGSEHVQAALKDAN